MQQALKIRSPVAVTMTSLGGPLDNSNLSNPIFLAHVENFGRSNPRILLKVSSRVFCRDWSSSGLSLGAREGITLGGTVAIDLGALSGRIEVPGSAGVPNGITVPPE